MADVVRCITVRQPWAHLIIAGHKDVENRKWSTPYRGELAVHAGLSWDEDGEEFARRLGIELPPRASLIKGAVVGIVDLVDVSPSSSPWAQPDNEHWRLENARPVEPFGVVGRLGLWSVTIPDGHREVRHV